MKDGFKTNLNTVPPIPDYEPDVILLPVKGKTAENLKRTLERPAPNRNYSKEEEEKVLKIW